MNPVHLVSPLQQIGAFIGNVKAEIRAGAAAKSLDYNYDFEQDQPIAAGRILWLGDDDDILPAPSTQARLSVLTSSTASTDPIPAISDSLRK